MLKICRKKTKETLILLRRFLKRIAVSMKFNCFIRKHLLCQGVLSPVEIANYRICLRWPLIMAKKWAVSRRFCEWNASVVKTALKSVEVKTNSIVPFSRTLLIHWIQCLTSTVQVRMVTDRNLKRFGHRFQVWTWYSPKVRKNLIWIAFPGKIHMLISFWLTRNVFAFNSNTMVRFLASFGVKTAKLPQWPCRVSTFGS